MIAFLRFAAVLIGCAAALAFRPARGLEPAGELRLHVSWGHASTEASPFDLAFSSEAITVADVQPEGLEPGEELRDGVWRTRAGGGDVDGVCLILRFDEVPVTTPDDLNSMWRDLIALSDPDTARRLRLDAGYRRDPRKLTVALDREGTLGFSVTVDQLRRHGAFWAPSLGLYLTAGDPPMPLAEHRKRLAELEGRRILDQVAREPEADYAQYTARWEDMGSPAYEHPSQPEPGHIIGLTWDSAIPKFGIDRGAGVWPDYGNPDRFGLMFDVGAIGAGLKERWKGQRLADGLPVVTTEFEHDGIGYEIEQFAYPLAGPPPERRGDIGMVLLSRVRLVNLRPQARTVTLGMTHRREHDRAEEWNLVASREGRSVLIEDERSHRVLLALQADAAEGAAVEIQGEQAPGDGKSRPAAIARVAVKLDLPASGSRTCVVLLPSPVVGPDDRAKLLALDFDAARDATLRFWSDYVARGAQFEAPEKVVNDLFRASLWHALRLPRRHGGSEEGVAIDLPYSNFAYDQRGTPWPVNQAVYVDAMIYDLRGYHAIAAEELATIYRNNQGPDGRVGGYANWGVYTPSMMYATARNYLLSHDRAAFERLLPATLRAMDWCLAELRKAAEQPGPARGLVRLPLNDLTGEGVWAFNQAYLFAGLDLLGRALDRYGHPRAGECRQAAAEFRKAVHRAFAGAAVRSPLVELRDGTFIPYVPCEALTPRRLFDQWYPTDVDTGAVHLLRLDALDPAGPLADSLLNDHEDNLYLHGWGMANEPVYNQQATAYLLRDDPKAVIRAFYSYMACAFSHSALEPVEHRWTWGQYFGPPSTDGAWFDLYRHMLARETDGNSLLLFQAVPRRWLDDGKRIVIQRAPTWFGPISATLESRAGSGELRADLRPAFVHNPAALRVRFRHPEGKPIDSVTVNGEPWPHFDRGKEWVEIPMPNQPRYTIVVRY